MSIACPYCKSVLTPRGLEPGEYTPKCPKCNNPFLLIVPDEVGGTISVRQLAKKQSSAAGPETANPPITRPTPPPSTARLPAASSRPEIKTAPPDAITDKLVKGSGIVKPPARSTPPPPKLPPDAVEQPEERERLDREDGS